MALKVLCFRVIPVLEVAPFVLAWLFHGLAFRILYHFVNTPQSFCDPTANLGE